MNILQYIVSTIVGSISFVGIAVVTLQYPTVMLTAAILLCILAICFKIQSVLIK